MSGMDPRQPPPGRLLCLGLGYTALALADRLAARGFQIAGTSRSPEGAAAITRRGWQGLVLSGTHSLEVAAAIAEATHILVSVPPDEAGDPALRLHGDDIAAARKLEWIGYLSTIGVYGDQAGAWVDEATPVAPTSARSRRRVAAATSGE